jgi:cell division septation protein DedD
MVTRRTRNYKEKKPMTTFGQFILPLTVIMALALLFFSVKLFFFNTDGTDEITVPREETVKQAPADPVPAERPAEITHAAPAVKKVEVKPAQPVDVKKEEAKKESTAAAVKAPAKPAAAVKETAPKTEAPQKTEAKSVRWDIQIGAFASKENALQLIEKARKQGHEVYLVEEKKNGAPFYKVRVKNPKTGRDDAVALSKVLEKEGYPYFLVEIK